LGESSEFSKLKLVSWYRALSTGPWKLIGIGFLKHTLKLYLNDLAHYSVKNSLIFFEPGP